MTREEAKELLPIMQAYSEGKTIQIKARSKWVDLREVDFNCPSNEYRVKPESKYRQFKTKEECWQEMLQHRPFGWIKSNEDGHYAMVTTVDDIEGEKYIAISGNNLWSFDDTINNYTFADGTPFGIKED